jgi:hypothetical protein
MFFPKSPSHHLSGIVPLDSLVRVLLSSSEFEPRLTSEDVRIMVAGLQVPTPAPLSAIVAHALKCLQPYISLHSFSHGGGESVIDWTAVMQSLLQVMQLM